MINLPCTCESPGFCPVYNRQMGVSQHSICNGTRLTPEKQAVYKQNWLNLSGQTVHPEYCLHRGEGIGQKTCNTCGNRGKPVNTFRCSLFGECSIDRYQVGQGEAVCKECDSRVSVLKPKWDRKIDNLIPATNNQNFNCSIINWQGRKIVAYRHNWSGSRIVICELNDRWQPIWNTKLEFPNHPHNVYQEDPRLFIYRNQLHVSYTAVQVSPRTITHVGYAHIAEVAPSTWQVMTNNIPHYPDRRDWEKNWGFFEAEDRLWAVYDTSKQNILSIENNKAKMAYRNNIDTAENFGNIRGGSAPRLHKEQFYSFFHYQKPPQNYTTGLYTFDPKPPFKPIAYIPYPIISPKKEDAQDTHMNTQVVYPCGAAVFNSSWIISYGAYDHDCRLAAFDEMSVDNSLKKSEKQSDIHAAIDKVIEKCQGWCDSVKGKTLVDLVFKHRPKLVVEIGVFGGRSLIAFALACKQIDHGHVIGIDAWNKEVALEGMVEPIGKEWWEQLDLQEVYTKFLDNLTEFGVKNFTTIVKEDSNLVTPPPTIDMLHVDGSHEKTATNDITRFGANVIRGGLVILDDLDWSSGAPRAGADWLLTNGFRELYRLGTGAVYQRT